MNVYSTLSAVESDVSIISTFLLENMARLFYAWRGKFGDLDSGGLVFELVCTIHGR